MGAAKRASRKKTSSRTIRRRSPKTGRFMKSSGAWSRAVPGFCADVLLRHELFCELVTFVDSVSLAALCEAMATNRATLSLVFDSSCWHHLLQVHCDMQSDCNPTAAKVHRSIPMVVGCDALAVYVSLRGQLASFERHVTVVKGDLGVIQSVDGVQVDCLVFPTSCTYRNPARGVAARVHERAGPSLDLAVKNVGLRGMAAPGSVMSTVGCDSDMRVLAHCVGPAAHTPGKSLLLYKTYVNALLAANNHHVGCAAVASISTGLLAFPVPMAADLALSAVRDLIRMHPRWATKIAFVCVDDIVYQWFEHARQETHRAFYTKGFAFPQVLSPRPVAEPFDHES